MIASVLSPHVVIALPVTLHAVIGKYVPLTLIEILVAVPPDAKMTGILTDLTGVEKLNPKVPAPPVKS